MPHVSVCWGSGLAKCPDCGMPILKGDVQMAFFGFKTSARYHARCLFKQVLGLVKDSANFQTKKTLAETINQMKEFIARRDEVMLKGHSLKVGDKVWNNEGDVGNVKTLVGKYKVIVRFMNKVALEQYEVWYLSKKGGDEDAA